MTAKNDTTKRLQLKQDRQLIRSRWHSSRFVVARVTAPEVETSTERQPVNLAFVIDRSGSMHGKPIELAMKAVEEAIRRLKSSDRFSVVVFDDEVDTVVPGVFATPEAKSRAIEEIRRVGARGSTNLSGGWLHGCKLVATELLELGVNRTLLLTDGLANQGITTLEELEHHAAQLRARGVSTSHLRHGRPLRREPAAAHGPGRRRPVLRHRHAASRSATTSRARSARRWRSWRATSRSTCASRRACASSRSVPSTGEPATTGRSSTWATSCPARRWTCRCGCRSRPAARVTPSVRW